MVIPALVVRRCWSEIFEVCELLALQLVSIVGERLALAGLAVDKARLVNHGALLRVGVSLAKAFAEVLTSGSRRLERADKLKC